jgi:uncharacterized linocin/CFP29 family protein
MGFLVALAAKVVEWLLVTWGHSLYEYSVKLVEAEKQAKIDKKNLADYKQAVKEKDLARQAEAARKLANGEK